MRWFILVLTAGLACACSAQLTSARAIPMAMLKIPPSNTDKEIQEAEEAPIPLPKPDSPLLPTLAEEEFEDAFMHVASCYDFHIPPQVLKGSHDKVRVPCLMKGFEKAMQGQPEVPVNTRILSLKALGREIYSVGQGLTLELSPVRYFPKLCVEPPIVGGTFPPAMRCSNLRFEDGTDKYSLTGSNLWYLLYRKAAQDAQQKGP